MLASTSLVLAFSLSMDSFAAALGRGAVLRQPSLGEALRIGTAFGLCQLTMPLVGWALGAAFAGLVAAVDHWIAFALLLMVGGAMVRGFFAADEDGEGPRDSAMRAGLVALLVTGIATSIDAAAVGVGLAVASMDIIGTAMLIGIVTFTMAFGGVMIGRAAGPLLGRWAELIGGLGLIAIGGKILVEHTLL